MFKNQLILFVVLTSIVLISCQTKTKTVVVVETEKPCCTAEVKTCCSQKATDVKATQVVYFHNERRCATCMAVEEVTKDVIAQLDSTTISFNSYELGDSATTMMVKDLKIAGQTLLIISKDTIIDLTNSAFMNARVNPDQFKADLKSALDNI